MNTEPMVSRNEGSEVVRMYLKPERIQLMLLLQSVPGWHVLPDARAIDRLRELPTAELAVAYAAFVEKLGRSSRVPVSVHVADRHVLVTLRGPRSHGKPGPITQKVLDLARQIG